MIKTTAGTIAVKILMSRSSNTEKPMHQITAIKADSPVITTGQRCRNISHTATSKTRSTNGKSRWMLKWLSSITPAMFAESPTRWSSSGAKPAAPNACLVCRRNNGIRSADRSASDLTLACPVLTIVGDDEEERERWREAARFQLAFYGSTPAYRPVLECHGWGELQTELNGLSKRGRWQEMAGLVSDEMMETLTLVQTLKLTKPMPIVVYGEEYWNEVVQFEKLVSWGTIEKQDLSLFRYCNSPEEAFESFDPTVTETPFEVSRDGGRTWRSPLNGASLDTVHNWMVDESLRVVDTKLVGHRRNGRWEGQYILTIGPVQ